MNKKSYELASNISARKALMVFMTCVFIDVAAHAQENPQPNPVRLDMPVTHANSVLVDFGDDTILRVPKILMAESMIPKDLKQPIKMDQISMVFRYPDMVETTYPSAMKSIFERQEGRPEPTPDRFPVYIKWLFRSREVLGSTN